MKPIAILKKGHAAFFAKPADFPKAKDCFQQVVLSAPKWGEGYLWLASACENLKEHRQAIKSYKQAIQCDPNDPRPKIALGRLLTGKGRLKEAIVELQKGVELKPHYCEADARLFLAEVYEKAKNIHKAKEQWKMVEETDPSYLSYDKPMRKAREKLKEYAKNS